MNWLNFPSSSSVVLCVRKWFFLVINLVSLDAWFSFYLSEKMKKKEKEKHFISTLSMRKAGRPVNLWSYLQQDAFDLNILYISFIFFKLPYFTSLTLSLFNFLVLCHLHLLSESVLNYISFTIWNISRFNRIKFNSTVDCVLNVVQVTKPAFYSLI